MQTSSDRWIQIGACAIFMTLSTWLLFGPMGGFHHLYAFGIFDYMVWDGDGPGPNLFQIGSFGVAFSLARFSMSLLVWLFVAALAAAPLVASNKRRSGRQ
jgi:hypothetical protein